MQKRTKRRKDGRKLRIELSELGLGCMRLPVIDGNASNIDVEKVRELIKFAVENGVMSVTLGKRILRTETAGIVTSAIVLYELG